MFYYYEQPMDLKKTEEAYLALIKQTGEDAQREGLIKTPHRAAKAFD